MSCTTNITLDMCINELKRQRRYMESNYPKYVKQQKITPYERDHRLNVNKQLLDLLQKAKQNKGTNSPTFLQLLTQLD